jgi:anti-sigma factor RsiW
MHLEEEQLERLRHGQPGAVDEPAIRAHLAECPECQQRLARANRVEGAVFAVLKALDHPPPQLDAEHIVRVARRHRPQRWAAIVLLSAGVATAVYATPGSPLPRWSRALVSWLTGHQAVTAAPGAPALSGIAVSPGTDLLIEIPSALPGAILRVTLTGDSQVVAQAPVGSASFRVEPHRLVIDNRDSAVTIDLRIPAAAAAVEIMLGSRSLLRKQHANIISAVHPDSAGRYLIPLIVPGP